MVISLRARQLMLVVLTVTIICEVSGTTERCNSGDTSHCFVEKIEKSRHKIKHTIQLKSLDVPLALLGLHDTIIKERRPGQQILENITDITVVCKNGWAGQNCSSCAQGFIGDNCNICDVNFGPAGQCSACLRGWGPPGECSRCRTGLTGQNCSECDRGWTGPDCDVCATNYGPPGDCDTCLAGWIGPQCQYCEGFGFSIESNCTKCIQNGRWEGMFRSSDVEVYFTFTGSSCSELVPGTTMKKSTIITTVTSGSVDEANEKFTFRNDNWEFFLMYYTDDKSLIRTDNNQYLTYRGMS